MKARLKYAGFAVLLAIASTSIYGALRNAFSSNRGQDFQWTGAHLTAQGIDPYAEYLAGDPGHLIQKIQIPNYLHELYVLLLPLGVLSLSTAQLAWAFINCLLTVAILFMLKRVYGLTTEKTFLLAVLFCAGTPFRITLAAGQQAMLELAFFCLAFYPATRTLKGLALGLSYFKYSFSPVLVLYLSFRRQYRLLLFSVLPPLFGLLVMWAFVHGNLFHLAVEPFQVSGKGVWPGLGDLMTVLQSTFKQSLATSTLHRLMYCAALGASLVTAVLLARRPYLPSRVLLTVTGVGGLAFFLHLTYDYVFLVLPLSHCLSGRMDRSKAVILAMVAWIWYGIKVLDQFTHAAWRYIQISTLGLLILMMFLILSRPEREPASTEMDVTG